MKIFERIADAIIARVCTRNPDFIIGGRDDPYLLRWWVLPRNLFFNVYVHKFLRDDDDRALHDHPWPWCSILLRGQYLEHTIARGGIHLRRSRTQGSVRCASPWRAHRIELFPEWWFQDEFDEACAYFLEHPNEKRPCITLFITGPRMRSWGFHCPERGWVHWREFTATDDPGAIGKGCAE